MRIFVDMDGVLADFCGRFNGKLNKAGILVAGMAHSWTLTERIMDRIGNKNAYINRLLSAPGFWSGIAPIDGGCETVMRWVRSKKHEVYIATAPWITSPTCMDEKVEWIRKFLPKFPVGNIIMIARKELLRGDIIIDDKPSHVFDWQGLHAICFAQPWNTNVKPRVDLENRKCVWKAHDWSAVEDLVAYITHTAPEELAQLPDR